MIKTVSKNNIEDVLPLIRKYMEFYKVANICDDRNREFFGQFGESSEFGCQFIFRESGLVLGFATVYFSFTSTITAKVAVLNDLYTLPDHRGKGVGRKLIEYCREFAVKHGAARLQWATSLDNESAQKLYDAMPTEKCTWHFYTYGT